MDPIEAWVDVHDLRRMADALLSSSTLPPDPGGADDCLYGSDFVGYGPDSEPCSMNPGGETLLSEQGVENSARRALAAARDLAQRGGMLEPKPQPGRGESMEPGLSAELTQVSPVEAAVASSATPSKCVKAPFMTRLEAFGSWLRNTVGARCFFVIDRAGGVLIDEVRSQKLHRMALTLAQASYSAVRESSGEMPGNLHAKIGPDSVLEVVPVLSSSGPLILGIVFPRSLDASQAALVVRGMQEVIHGPAAGGTP